MPGIRRAIARLSFFALIAMLFVSHTNAQSSPGTTLVSDVLFRADGEPAQGTLLISWPAFTAANGQAIAAGRTSVTLGPGGTLSVALVPNAGATPANSYYSVVYQLDVVKTEYWLVPSDSPASIAQVRTTLGSGTTPGQSVSKQYVDAAVATKANDLAVIHLTGSETISGAKQFAVSPVVPMPLQPTDAVNKAYVDDVVGNAGSGSYVNKAGDTMTGPLVLSGGPTTANQAVTRQYVDLASAMKADLAGGVVPTAQLGSGNPDSTTCLKGDSTWGACGTSSSAISIQNVPVDTAIPTANQVLTYDGSTGKYTPKAGGGLTAGMQAVKYSSDFNWSQSPSTNLTTAGAKTVNLSLCPAGVKANEPEFWVYIAGAGTPEAVKVTGGTCNGDGQPGTLQITTANSHGAGYAISSASSGLQEALIAARVVMTNPTAQGGGKVIVPPGELKVYGRVSIRTDRMTVDFSGSVVECWLNDVCILVGSSSGYFSDITLINPTGRPTVPLGTKPFIEDAAQKTRIINLASRNGVSGGTFGTYVQVDNDQAFLLDGMDTNYGYGMRCDATYCGAYVTAPGPFSTNAAVGWLKNLNISMQCSGNGVDWESGNTLKISDSVIQGFAQYGVRGGTPRGGYHGTTLDNTYMEVGNCTNPLGNIGEMGVLQVGAPIYVHSSEKAAGVQGKIPLVDNSGSVLVLYYAVIRDVTTGKVSAPYLFAYGTSNGTASVPLSWPKVTQGSDTITYDILKFSSIAMLGNWVAPFGTGNYAIATNVPQCAGGACSLTDSQAAATAYTVATQTFAPNFSFWPGGIVLVGTTAFLDYYEAGVYDGSAVVSNDGGMHPSVYATKCYGATPGGGPLMVDCLGADPASISATMLHSGIDNGIVPFEAGVKGRLNFSRSPQSILQGMHLATLVDSNPAKTAAYGNNRPPYDTQDTFIGLDNKTAFTAQSAQAQLAFGSPMSISNYINNPGDGTNWLERLTAGMKEFKTNVQMDAALTVAGTLKANSFVSTGAGAFSLQGNYGTLSPAQAGTSLLGFGSNGKLQVSENGAAIQEVAKIDSSGTIAANANSATQLAQSPSQCNGSFATGIQPNGNANCAAASVLQLAETAQPAGIPNYGIFWFDASCHCPRIISNNGQAVQLTLTNVFNANADTLEEYNGTTPQTLNIYGTRSNASNYERLAIGYDTPDGYFYIGSQAGGTGALRGFGFMMGSSLRWVFDSSYHFKPWSDNLKDIGSATLRVRDVYLGRNLVMSGVASTYNGRTTAGPGLVATYGTPVSSSPNTAAIASTVLCNTTSCPAGQYVVEYYLSSTAACATPGSAAVALTLAWADETSAKSLQVPLTGVGVSGGNTMAMGNTGNFASGSLTLWSAGSAAINYSSTYTACTTGTGGYAVRMAVRQVQ